MSRLYGPNSLDILYSSNASRRIPIALGRSATRRCRATLRRAETLSCSFLETSPSMTTSDQSHRPAHIVDDVEVVKDLEQRGFHGLDSLSLEELELLAERKRKQLHLEATEKKANLESEITSIGQQIKEMQARKVTLETQLRALAKFPGLASGGGERNTRRNPRKPRNPAETQPPSTPEA
jgi:hypothetical protein